MTTETQAQGLLGRASQRGAQDHRTTHPGPRAPRRARRQLTAEELAPSSAVGRATVYRTIKLLLEHGLICRVILSDGCVCYRLSNKAHHHHLVCVGCGATEDVHLADVEAVLSGVREATDYEMWAIASRSTASAPTARPPAGLLRRLASTITTTSRFADRAAKLARASNSNLVFSFVAARFRSRGEWPIGPLRYNEMGPTIRCFSTSRGNNPGHRWR